MKTYVRHRHKHPPVVGRPRAPRLCSCVAAFGQARRSLAASSGHASFEEERRSRPPFDRRRTPSRVSPGTGTTCGAPPSPCARCEPSRASSAGRTGSTPRSATPSSSPEHRRAGRRHEWGANDVRAVPASRAHRDGAAAVRSSAPRATPTRARSQALSSARVIARPRSDIAPSWPGRATLGLAPSEVLYQKELHDRGHELLCQAVRCRHDRAAGAARAGAEGPGHQVVLRASGHDGVGVGTHPARRGRGDGLPPGRGRRRPAGVRQLPRWRLRDPTPRAGRRHVSLPGGIGRRRGCERRLRRRAGAPVPRPGRGGLRRGALGR